MAIAVVSPIAATGNTANQSTPYALGTLTTPPADHLLMVVATVAAASPLSPLTIGGGLAASWVEIFNLDVMGGRRLAAWAAYTGPTGIGSGNITVGNATAMGMTGIVYQVLRWSGTYLGGSPADCFYGLGENSGTVITLKAAPTPPYAAAGDATLAFLAMNVNAAVTCERTELGDAGFTSPNHRLGVQWFLGDDADGPTFSWTGSAVAHAASIYLRDAAYTPPAPAWQPSLVTVHA